MKQVIFGEEIKEVVKLRECRNDKIYVVKTNWNTYKLQHTGNKYLWVCLSDSYNLWLSGESLVGALRAIIELGHTVYEFDTLKEFAEWLVRECK